MTTAERMPPIAAARLACRAQRIELAKLAGQISKLRYASPAAHVRMAESIDVAAAALLGLDRVFPSQTEDSGGRRDRIVTRQSDSLEPILAGRLNGESDREQEPRL